MAERARELGLDLAASDVRVTIHAGEPGASIPTTRAAIESAFRATSFDHTGMTELGPTGHSCSQRDGIHLIEPEFIFEVVDARGRPTLEGELVATNLGRWGMPLIRYRTGDRVRLSHEPCSCGNPFAKLVGRIMGLTDTMFTVPGGNLYPSQVHDIVRRHAGLAEYVIERSRRERMDEVTLAVEGSGALSVERLEADLRQALCVRRGCRIGPGRSLPRGELKSKRVVHVKPG